MGIQGQGIEDNVALQNFYWLNRAYYRDYSQKASLAVAAAPLECVSQHKVPPVFYYYYYSLRGVAPFQVVKFRDFYEGAWVATGLVVGMSQVERYF